jgi:acetyl-CoA carboxylase carboxyltransferase component
MGDKRDKRIEQLQEVKEKARKGGGDEKIAAQHKKGKMVARERIDYLLDEGSFVEFNMLLGYAQDAPGDGIVSGHGTIDGRRVCIYCQDPTVRGGSVGALHGFKQYRTIEMAAQMGVPLIALHDSPGARLPRLTDDQGGMGGSSVGDRNAGSVIFPNTQASGVVPQISAILGSCAGIAVYSPALTDFIFMVDHQSHMFITGPLMVKAVMGEEISYDDLGGAAVHCKVSGVADRRFPGEKECLDSIRELLRYLPSNNSERSPVERIDDSPDRMNDDLLEIVPTASNRPYDMNKVICSVLDGGRFFEIKPEFAGEMIVGFGRLDGQAVGIIANQPMVRAGSLTVDASDKQARFIRFCDCFNIPMILLIDTPAYMPGRSQEHAGIIRHGAKVLYALCEATVPRIAVIIRKVYGGATLGMGIVPGLGTDLVYCWPTAETGVLGAEASVALYFGKEIATAENPDKLRKEKIQEFSERYSNPVRDASSNWSVVDVIEPRETRKTLIRGFAFLATKRRDGAPLKRHGNIPL